jgi:glycosyltransferase involved in cell wall biosynthesis
LFFGEGFMVDAVPISVVIPAYNSEEFIGEAIRSVKAQSFPVAEVIVVDDGSSDRTAEVAERLGARVIRRRRGGISVARNAGIRAAKHEWIAFLDADDLWTPQKIEYQWAAIRRHPDAGLVSCDLVQWVQGSGMPATAVSESTANGEAYTEAKNTYVPRPQGAFLRDRMTYNSPTMLIRKNILFSVGLFDEAVHYVEGIECYLRVIAQCAVVLVDRPLVMQRLHERNTSLNSLEMGLSWIRLVDRLIAEPEKYPPGAGEVFDRKLSGEFIVLGRSLLDEGRRHEARALFNRSLKQSYSRRAIFLWGLSFLGPAIFKWLLGVKRKLSSNRANRKLAAALNAEGR